MDLIDIHTHILPGIDDGAKDLKESLAMAEAALKNGVNLLVATPRVIQGCFDNSKESILQNVETFNQCLQFARVKLPVLPGALYALNPHLAELYRAGQLLTINNTGRYLLVELPTESVPDYTQEVFDSLLKQGIIPIIAQPETNRALVRHPEVLQLFSNIGVLVQITAASIVGRHGRGAKNNSWAFLENGSAHLIASNSQPSAGRQPVLYEAFQEVERRLGASVARTLISHNPYKIIQGQPIKHIDLPHRGSLWERFCKMIDA